MERAFRRDRRAKRLSEWLYNLALAKFRELVVGRGGAAPHMGAWMWRYASLKALLALARDIAGGEDDDETDPSFTHHASQDEKAVPRPRDAARRPARSRRGDGPRRRGM